MVVTTKVVFFYFLFNFLCLFLKKIYLGQYWECSLCSLGILGNLVVLEVLEVLGIMGIMGGRGYRV